MAPLNPRSREKAAPTAVGRDGVKRTRREKSNKRAQATKPPPKKAGGVSPDNPAMVSHLVSIAPPPPVVSTPKTQTETIRAPVFAVSQAEEIKKKKEAERMKDHKEAKGNKKKKSDEKAEEKKTVRGTLRTTRKKTNTSTTSEGKTEDCPVKQKSKTRKKESNETPEKEKSWENKSSTSRERSEAEEKQKVARKEVAQSFFKDLKTQKQSIHVPPRRGVESLRMDVMPESSHLNQSVRAMKKKIDQSMRMKISMEVPEKTDRPDQEEKVELKDFFKPNGDPVWLVPERAPGDPVETTEDGTIIENPILALALAEDDLKIEEKTWADTVNEYLDEKIPPGQQLNRTQQLELDPFAEFKDLKKNDEFISVDTVNYLTARTLNEMCLEAVNRFERKRQGLDEPAERPRARRASRETDKKSTELVMKPSEFIEKGVVFSINFDLKRNIFISYDRRSPIVSAKALTRKLSMETDAKE